MMSWKDGSVGRWFAEQQVRVADDGLEHVVEVVRDAACELADGLHLLGLGELLLQLALLGGVQRVEDGALALGFPLAHRADPDPRRAPALARERKVDRRQLAPSLRGALQGRLERAAVAFLDTVDDGAALAVAAAWQGGEEPGKGGVGAEHAPGPVDDRDGDRRVVEESCEADLRRALPFRDILAGRAVEHERARGARTPVLAVGDPMIDADGERLPVPPSKVEVEGLRAHVAGWAPARGHQSQAIRRHHVRRGQAARADLGKVVVEPARQRGVHVHDRTSRIDRQEAGGGMVEVVDCVLKLLEDVLLPLALVRHVGDGPERGQSVARPGQRPHPDPVPAKLARRGRERRRQADLLARRPMLAGGLREAVDRLGHLRRAGEESLDGPYAGRAVAAGKRKVGLVGVDRATAILDGEAALARRVGHELGEVVPGALTGELERADGVGEQEEYPRHREQRHQPVDQRRRAIVGDEKEREKRADQHAGERQHQPDVPPRLRPVDHGAGGKIAHRIHGKHAVLGALLPLPVASIIPRPAAANLSGRSEPIFPENALRLCRTTPQPQDGAASSPGPAAQGPQPCPRCLDGT